MSAVLGTCIWCGHSLAYANPGNPPGDCLVDITELYDPPNINRDMSLIDVPLNFGKFCPDAPPHPLGQFSVHQLTANSEQP